ncbi:ACKR1 protein, partial [Scytalopus superciliaris]|nr:ACKR1 protein [Scytalopus superciliaris]
PQSPGTPGNQSLLDFEGIVGNFSYYDDDATLDYDATPCQSHFCPLFQRVAPPFLAATCAMGVLGTTALLVALAKLPQAWQRPQSRMLVAQLALGTGLFAAPLPALAAGIAWGWHAGTAPCRLT